MYELTLTWLFEMIRSRNSDVFSSVAVTSSQANLVIYKATQTTLKLHKLCIFFIHLLFGMSLVMLFTAALTEVLALTTFTPLANTRHTIEVGRLHTLRH
jgi:hypothetical protein